MRHLFTSVLALIAAPIALAAAPAVLVRPVAHEMIGAATSNGAAKYFAGLTLVDQNGRNVDLYRDVIADHTVVMHTFFSNCTASCPVTMNTLKVMQQRLGDRMNADVRLISITVDPLHDTPGALKDYASRIKAKSGWLFLSGSSEQVASALKRIGQYTDDPVEHMDLLVAGNDRTGLWKKIRATATADEITGILMGVADDRGE